MKTKLFLLGLVATLSLSGMAQEKVYVKDAVKTTNRVAVQKQALKGNLPLAPQFRSSLRADIPEGMALITLTAGNVWDDGTGYQMLLDADATAYGTIIPETGGLTTGGDIPASTYAEFEYKIPENADGALTTQNIVIENSISILIPAGTYDWCITNPTPGDRMWIASSNGNVPGRYDDFVFQAGVNYVFSVALNGQNDAVTLTIPVEGQALTTPENLTVEPAATSAALLWEDNDDMGWALRYRPYVDPATVSQLWDFPYPGYEAQIADFMVYDVDGDGFNWNLAYSDDSQTDVCLYSESYSSTYWESLDPDNWLITPAVGLGGTLKFKTWNYSSSYVDRIAVYVCPNAEWETTDDFILLQDNIMPGLDPEEIEIDLSAYEGLGYIAFRHYNSYDMFRIYLDDIEVTVPGAQPVPEWTYVYDLTDTNYLIEGLTPETEYEVQVQAVGLAGTSDWTEALNFITLKGGSAVDEVVTGKTVAGVRYFNVAGQEVAQPNGLTIQVTTYTDGSTTAVKVVK